MESSTSQVKISDIIILSRRHTAYSIFPLKYVQWDLNTSQFSDKNCAAGQASVSSGGEERCFSGGVT